MQVLLSLPGADRSARQLTTQKVCGVPLVARVIATALRCGCDSVLLVHSEDAPEAELGKIRGSKLFGSAKIETVRLDNPFNPEDPAAWSAIAPHLRPKVLWLPWNFVPDKSQLRAIVRAGEERENALVFESAAGAFALDAPMVIVARAVQGSLGEYIRRGNPDVVPTSAPAGWRVDSETSRRAVERELVRRSGKESDGIYSKFNRRLVRSLVRWLTYTNVTPNVVTIAGLPLALLSGYFFAQGNWPAYVAGALLYFANVLLDEVDGMLARVRFLESPFGCWLETFTDYASYVPLFGGISIGLYRERGLVWLGIGAWTLLGALITFIVLIHQRKIGAPRNAPSEYNQRYNRLLEQDSANIVSRLVRQLHFLLKKGVLAHYVVLFAVFGGLPLFLALAAFSANAAWIVSLYNNRLFSSTSKGSVRPPAPVCFHPLSERRGIQ